MPYGGFFLAVGDFSFYGGNDFGGGGKTKYGGNFSTVVGGFCFLAVTTLAEAIKPKYDGKPPYYRLRPPGRQFHGGKVTDDSMLFR